jgi:hypothetical protein
MLLGSPTMMHSKIYGYFFYPLVENSVGLSMKVGGQDLETPHLSECAATVKKQTLGVDTNPDAILNKESLNMKIFSLRPVYHPAFIFVSRNLNLIGRIDRKTMSASRSEPTACDFSIKGASTLMLLFKHIPSSGQVYGQSRK